MPESKDIYQLGFSKVAGCLLDFSPSQVQKFFQKQSHLWMFKYLLKSDLTEYVINQISSHLIFFALKNPYHYTKNIVSSMWILLPLYFTSHLLIQEKIQVFRTGILLLLADLVRKVTSFLIPPTLFHNLHIIKISNDYIQEFK